MWEPTPKNRLPESLGSDELKMHILFVKSYERIHFF
jgi:hypothetical protein